MDPARTGRAIVEYGVHTLDLARWLIGEATRVCATARTWIPARPLANGVGHVLVAADDSTAWLMEFAGGAIAVRHAGWATAGRPPGLELRLSGSEGALHCRLTDDLPDDQALELAGPDGRFQPVAIPPRLVPPTVPPDPWWRRWPAHLIHRFVAEIGGGDAVGPSFADGLRAQILFDAVQTSVREGRWVEVPAAAPPPDSAQAGPRPVTQS
jgi:predicted dehydrogenase